MPLRYAVSPVPHASATLAPHSRPHTWTMTHAAHIPGPHTSSSIKHQASPPTCTPHPSPTPHAPCPLRHPLHPHAPTPPSLSLPSLPSPAPSRPHPAVHLSESSHRLSPHPWLLALRGVLWPQVKGVRGRPSIHPQGGQREAPTRWGGHPSSNLPLWCIQGCAYVLAVGFCSYTRVSGW